MTRPVRLRSRWPVLGPQPKPGMWMMARRGRVAYQITAVRKLDENRNLGGYRYSLSCERFPRSEVPEGTRVAEWRWDRR